MATDLRKYYDVLRRLRRDNPRLDRTMLEQYLRATYRDELEKLNLNVSDIYDGCVAEDRSILKPSSRSAPRQRLGRRRRTSLPKRK
jgi:hypothetical protein